MVGNMLYGLPWSVCVCIGFFGWGSSLARFVRLPRDLGTAGCLGVSLAVCYGGVVDLLRIGGWFTSGALVALGAIACVLQVRWLEFEFDNGPATQRPVGAIGAGVDRFARDARDCRSYLLSRL